MVATSLTQLGRDGGSCFSPLFFCIFPEQRRAERGRDTYIMPSRPWQAAGCSQRHLINSPSGLLPRNFCSQKYVCHAVGRGVKGQGAHNIITAPFAIGKRFLLAQCGLKIREPWEFDRLLIAYFVSPIIGSHKASTRRIEFRNHVTNPHAYVHVFISKYMAKYINMWPALNLQPGVV